MSVPEPEIELVDIEYEDDIPIDVKHLKENLENNGESYSRKIRA